VTSTNGLKTLRWSSALTAALDHFDGSWSRIAMGAGINVRKVAVVDLHTRFDTGHVVWEDIWMFALARELVGRIKPPWN
jgi:hypothetical protein